MYNPKTHKARRRIERLSIGMCPVHANAVVAPGRTKCEKCLLTTRLCSLRNKGLPEWEVERARQAVAVFDGRCQCCGGTATGNRQRGFHLDHDDVAKRFRGVICALCNLTIGHAKESIARLQSAIQYLRYAEHGMRRPQ